MNHFDNTLLALIAVSLVLGFFAAELIVPTAGVLEKVSISGYVASETAVSNRMQMVFIAVLLFIAALVILLDYERRQSGTDCLSSLMSKKVYTHKGEQFGEVVDLILLDNILYEVRIRLSPSKRRKFGRDGVAVKFKGVKSIGEIMFIDDEVLEKLEKLTNIEKEIAGFEKEMKRDMEQIRKDMLKGKNLTLQADV